MKEKIVLGMSGGVDSSVAAVLLQKAGYEVIGVTMNLCDNNDNSNIEAKKVCDKLGISHFIVDFKKEFKQFVMKDFIEKYMEAKTPNPCVECNKYLKFGLMIEKAKELGAKYIATGHYAKIEFSQKYNSFVLKKSLSEKKDQSYFLYNIKKEYLPFIKFPLANFKSKDEIRKIAQDYKLDVFDKKDSQEICFITNNNYKDFLNSNLTDLQKQNALKSGCIYDGKGVLRGEHKGIANYTIGQRKGLKIQNEKPLYVQKIDKVNNCVIVEEKENLYYKKVIVNDLNWLVNIKDTKLDNVQVKIRYLAKPTMSNIYINKNNVEVEFKEEQFAPTPGQSIVFYDNDIVLGGGKIE